jgi:sugar phosphate permease
LDITAGTLPARYRWIVLATGTFAQSTFATVSVGLPALAPALRSHYALSLGEIGVVLGAVGLGMLLTLLPWGLLADRVGERAVIAVGLAGAAIALGVAAVSATFVELCAALVLAGALGASVNAASGRAVMGWFGAGERGLALGIRQTAIPIGGAVAAASLPWLASAGGTRLAFFVLAGASAVGAVIAAVLMRDAPPATVHVSADLRAPVRDPRMWLLGGGSALYLVAQTALTTFVVLFLHEDRGLSAGAAAGVLAAINVVGIGARIAAGRWSDRVRARVRPIRSIGVALTAAVVVVATLVDAPLAVLVPAIVVAGVLSLSWNGLSFTAAAETAGLARSGAALGFQQTLLGVTGAAVPPAFAALVAGSSWRVAFAASALGPLLGVLALRRVPEPTSPRVARRSGTSALPPATR